MSGGADEDEGLAEKMMAYGSSDPRAMVAQLVIWVRRHPDVKADIINIVEATSSTAPAAAPGANTDWAKGGGDEVSTDDIDSSAGITSTSGVKTGMGEASLSDESQPLPVQQDDQILVANDGVGASPQDFDKQLQTPPQHFADTSQPIYNVVFDSKALQTIFAKWETQLLGCFVAVVSVIVDIYNLLQRVGAIQTDMTCPKPSIASFQIWFWSSHAALLLSSFIGIVYWAVVRKLPGALWSRFIAPFFIVFGMWYITLFLWGGALVIAAASRSDGDLPDKYCIDQEKPHFRITGWHLAEFLMPAILFLQAGWSGMRAQGMHQAHAFWAWAVGIVVVWILLGIVYPNYAFITFGIIWLPWLGSLVHRRRRFIRRQSGALQLTRCLYQDAWARHNGSTTAISNLAQACHGIHKAIIGTIVHYNMGTGHGGGTGLRSVRRSKIGSMLGTRTTVIDRRDVGYQPRHVSVSAIAAGADLAQPIFDRFELYAKAQKYHQTVAQHMQRLLVDLIPVFASMRFPDGKPLPEALLLQNKLRRYNIDLCIVTADAGDSIHDTVFDEVMSKCVGFVAFGTVKYGQDTGSIASSHYEVLRWQEQYADSRGAIIPVRMISLDERFEHETARQVFGHDSLQLVLEKTLLTRIDIPAQIDNEMSNNVQGAVQGLWKDRIEQFWPTVMFSYATGSRADLDDPGAGPGLLLCATLILALDAAGIDSFSGLHVLPGQHWSTTYYDRLDGPRSQAKVMIVLLTRALYRSKACLEEIATALSKGLQLVPIRAEGELPPGSEQWPIELWGNNMEQGTDVEHGQTQLLEKIKMVKKGLGSFNHLPPRGVFQDLVNVELPRLIDLLVVKSKVLEPMKVFASIPEGKALDEADDLKGRLAELGIDLLIVQVEAGDSIHDTVFDELMAKCVGFVAMGSATYGQDTGNNVSTHHQVIRWNQQYAQVWGPIIPVRLIGDKEEFMHGTGKQVFSRDAVQIGWSDAESVAQAIALAVSKRIKRHPSVEGQTVDSVQRLVGKAKSFLWQTAWVEIDELGVERVAEQIAKTVSNRILSNEESSSMLGSFRSSAISQSRAAANATLTMLPIKPVQEAYEDVTRVHNGDFSLVADLLRCQVMYDSMEEVADGVERMEQDPTTVILRVDNGFDQDRQPGPMETGDRVVKLLVHLVEMTHGFVCQVELGLKDLAEVDPERVGLVDRGLRTLTSGMLGSMLL